MLGKIRRKQRAERTDTMGPAHTPVCPLCMRAIPPGEQDAHHLVPKSKGGRETCLLHRICHRQIHALFSETELARQYNTAEALLAHPEVDKFVRWIQTRPDDFSERVRPSHRRRRA